MAEPVVSEEYYEFLKRYEELNKEWVILVNNTYTSLLSGITLIT
jgi:argonaute-like protein implicated in RNA metabolism and viral defense